MRLRLDPNDGVPLGLQIARQIRLAVASGRLVPGERLPAARDLAADLRVNFHTVRRAYGDLEAEGLLRCERGRGTFVSDAAGAWTRGDLRETVRAHAERLAEDLAGSGLDADLVEAMVAEEVRRALGRRRAAR
jgi:GntR family transcriptional regulator